jgi:hypothetical protein
MIFKKKTCRKKREMVKKLYIKNQFYPKHNVYEFECAH